MRDAQQSPGLNSIQLQKNKHIFSGNDCEGVGQERSIWQAGLIGRNNDGERINQESEQSYHNKSGHKDGNVI